ncbi:hypothetical protein PoB_000725500 [Plakobranchus ocellatus]|uniref:Uncharacterized protein n=1 Tax=Plakobranchus ocellatus TaxID=259542 RepID=A0AAV3YCI2_9GAST|nr:hypothetical protein PoB_000725500 [Plakobranchus ocellatus]
MQGGEKWTMSGEEVVHRCGEKWSGIGRSGPGLSVPEAMIALVGEEKEVGAAGVTRQSDSRQTASRNRLAAARHILESMWRRPRSRQSYSLHAKTTLLKKITRS